MKLVLLDEASERMEGLWRDATGVAAVAVAYVETRAAVAAARRAQRLDARGYEDAKTALERRWRQIDAVAVDEALLGAAAGAAEHFALRALDALHLAAAVELGDAGLVFATWDQELARAAADAGLAVAP